MDLLRRVVEVIEDELADAGGPDFIDFMGEAREAERRLADVRRGLEAETEHGTRGNVYRVTFGTSTSRSYNTSALLRDFMKALDASMVSTILWLRDAGALEFSWKYSKLRTAAYKADVQLNEAMREITDGNDSAHIGEVRKRGSASYEPIEQGES